MGALIFVHRWLGVAFCLLFAMWFGSGIVMHFVPFPGLSEPERYAGLAVLPGGTLRHGPQAAVRASGIESATRVRLFSRPDGPVYVVHGSQSPQGSTALVAVRAADLSPAIVHEESLALAIAADHARSRGLSQGSPQLVALETYDQWTVPNGYDPHRPLYRVALNDVVGTQLYVSSRTGEVVSDTARRERAWNYAGSVVHWIYPTFLRRDWARWDTVVWMLSLFALTTALAGAAVGCLRFGVIGGRLASPYRGWHAWHHWLGVGCMIFILTWIASGWLSMDHGRLFSTGKLDAAELSSWRGAPPDWNTAVGGLHIPAHTREVEWFVFDARVYRREREALNSQRLFVTGDATAPRDYLAPTEVSAAATRLSPRCKTPFSVSAGDDYGVSSALPQAPVYRVICGETWYHVDGANGAVVEKLDSSRRAYRWLNSALHTFDFPALAARPALRTGLVVILCALGFAFSVTAVVIGWRRVRR